MLLLLFIEVIGRQLSRNMILMSNNVVLIRRGRVKYWTYIGMFSSLGAIALWLVLNFINPYNSEPASNDVLVRTGLFLLAPACVALIGSIINKRIIMFIAFFWSLPISLYLAMTPSIFKLFIVTSLATFLPRY